MTNRAPGFERIVTDASVIISLERLSPQGIGSELLQKLFGQILIPEKAMQEVTRFHKIPTEEYMRRYRLDSFLRVVPVQVDTALQDIQRLYDGKRDVDYEGEAYAITLAVHEGLRILLDDVTGISVALKNGLKPYNLGTATLRCFSKGLLTQTEAERLLLEGHSINMYSQKVYQQYLTILQGH